MHPRVCVCVCVCMCVCVCVCMCVCVCVCNTCGLLSLAPPHADPFSMFIDTPDQFSHHISFSCPFNYYYYYYIIIIIIIIIIIVTHPQL